jgi:hypothetical protein
MNYRHGFFMLVTGVLALCATGCPPPLGFAGENEGDPRVDSIMVVPHRSLYSVNDVLVRGSDFSVFAFYVNNTMIKIPSEEVSLEVIENIHAAVPAATPVPPEENYLFRTYGTKGVRVIYGDVSAQYMVQVLDPFGAGAGPGTGGNGPGITITW